MVVGYWIGSVVARALAGGSVVALTAAGGFAGVDCVFPVFSLVAQVARPCAGIATNLSAFEIWV